MLNPDYREMLSALSDQGAEYVLVGGYAMAAHGLPRATGDMDILVNPTPENATKVMDSLRAFGAPVSDVSEEDFTTPGTIFQMGVPPRRIDIITEIDGVSFAEAAADAAVVAIDDLEVPVISKANLIKNKRASGRKQDLADVERLEQG
jgi:hypothetical protein